MALEDYMKRPGKANNSIRRVTALFLAFVLVLQSSVSVSMIYASDEEIGESLVSEQIPEKEEAEAPAEVSEIQDAEEAPKAGDAEAQPDSETAQEVKQETPDKATEPAEAADADEDPAAKAEDARAGYPAQKFSGKAGGVSVNVKAPEGALPAGTTAEFKAVSRASAEKKIEKTTGDSINVVRAVDITFRNKDGKEIEPEKKVSVSFACSEFGRIEKLSVYHIDDRDRAEKLSDEKVKSHNDRVSIKVKDFSVYAVAGEEVGARLTINFYNGETLIDTIYIKAEDSDMNKILYDPGVGEVTGEQVFKGWAKDEKDYSKDTEPRTIEEIRKEAGSWDGESDETWNMYAMTFGVYHVSFLNEKNVTIKSDTVIYKAGDKEASYLIDTDYTPQDEEKKFEGWNAAGSSGITVKGASGDSDSTFKYGETVTLSGPGGGSVEFTVNAPKGNWLSFQENGHGASYTPPEFIETEEKTVEPKAPTRLGYEFKGWYENKECTGERFSFGDKIAKRTTLYAKWEPVPKADYTVIIWKQNVSGTGYDFEESIQLEGASNTAVDTVSVKETEYIRYVSIDGKDKLYPGFHLDRYDEAVNIRPEGTSIVNVYYNRNKITIGFYRFEQADPGKTGSWELYKTMSGLYGSTLAENGCEWPEEYNWYDTPYANGSAGGRRITFLDAFLPAQDETELKYYAQEIPAEQNGTIKFYKQDDDQQGYSIANTVSTSVNSFYISDKYTGYQAYEYRVDGGSWTPVGEISGGYYNSGEAVSFSSSMEIRFNRQKYNILFKDGAYFNGDGVETEDYSTGKIREIHGISYGMDISEYDSYEPHEKRAGYAFDGWYLDDACTHEYEFDTMPQGGLTVYARWVRIQYRVFLHPNVPSDDDSLMWAQTDQQTSFRVDHGEKISGGHTIMGNRKEYELIGWYTDEACTKSFNFDAYTLNEQTVTAEYDKTKSTELDQYGEPIEDTNKDTGRKWITKEFDLYAKWRSKVEGADGIKVQYDAGEGEDAPTDSAKYYLDNAEAMAGAAAKPKDKDSKFMYWVIQEWDENAGEYKDTDRHVYPGNTFAVLKKDAKRVVTEWEDEEHTEIKTATYTVQLRAEYDAVEHEHETHITWYANDGTGKKTEDPEKKGSLKSNQAVSIKDASAFTYEGHEFEGWARYESGDKPASSRDRSNLWLHYDSDTGEFRENDRKVVSEIAADERQPYHDLYAIWSAIVEIEIEGSVTNMTYNGLEQQPDPESMFKIRYKVAGKYVDKLPEGVTATVEIYNDVKEPVEMEDIKVVNKTMAAPVVPGINVSGTDAGTYGTRLIAYLTSDNPEYKVSSANGSDICDVVLNIARKPVTVKAADITKYVGAEDPELTWTVDGLAEGDDESVLDITLTREQGETEGRYSIVPAGDEIQGNYTVTYETGTFTINNIPPDQGEDQDGQGTPGQDQGTDPDDEQDPGDDKPGKDEKQKADGNSAKTDGKATLSTAYYPPAQQNIDENEVPESAPSDIDDSATPKLFPKPSPYYWAFMNLVITILTVLLSMMTIFAYLGKNKKKTDKNEQSSENVEERQQEVRKKSILKLIDVIPAATAVITFMLSEDMDNIMIMTDDYTPIMLFILLIDVVCAFFTRRSLRKTGEDKGSAEV